MRMTRATMVSISMVTLPSYLEVDDAELLSFVSLFQTSWQKTQTPTLQILETVMEVHKVQEDIKTQDRQEDTQGIQDIPVNQAIPAEEDIKASRATPAGEDIQMMTMAVIQAILQGDTNQLK